MTAPERGEPTSQAASAAGEERLRARVCARARELEVLPLLRVLARLGYGRGDVVFAARPGPVSQASLVHEVEFREQPRRHARVVLNLGLHGAQGLLPSYLQQRVDAGELDAQAFEALLELLEHALLSRFVTAAYPELDERLWDAEAFTRGCVGLLDLRAPAGLHWLCSAVFPELGVQVAKRAAVRDVHRPALRLGAALGAAALGDRAQVAVQGASVVLLADDERTAWGQPWAEVVRARLDAQVLPALTDLDLDLEVELVIVGRRTHARLDGGTQLGFSQVVGGRAPDHRMRIFAGRPGAPSGTAR